MYKRTPNYREQTALPCKNWQLLTSAAFMQKKVFEPVNCSLKYIQKDCILSESEKFYKLLKKKQESLTSKKRSDIFNQVITLNCNPVVNKS